MSLSPINLLPDELFILTFSELNIPEDLARTSRVCKRWNKLACHESLWKKFYLPPIQCYAAWTSQGENSLKWLSLGSQIQYVNFPLKKTDWIQSYYKTVRCQKRTLNPQLIITNTSIGNDPKQLLNTQINGAKFYEKNSLKQIIEGGIIQFLALDSSILLIVDKSSRLIINNYINYSYFIFDTVLILKNSEKILVIDRQNGLVRLEVLSSKKICHFKLINHLILVEFTEKTYQIWNWKRNTKIQIDSLQLKEDLSSGLDKTLMYANLSHLYICRQDKKVISYDLSKAVSKIYECQENVIALHALNNTLCVVSKKFAVFLDLITKEIQHKSSDTLKNSYLDQQNSRLITWSNRKINILDFNSTQILYSHSFTQLKIKFLRILKGSRLIFGTDKSLTLYEYQVSQKISEVSLINTVLCADAIDMNQSLLVIGCNKGDIKIWNLTGDLGLKNLNMSIEGISKLSLNKNHLVAYALNGQKNVWQLY